ncbi:hypothetical protein ACFL41_02040 [Gemmatimonadota bacterium]
MRRMFQFCGIALLLVTIHSSTSADPPEAFVGIIFSIDKMAFITVPEGDVLLLTGKTILNGTTGNGRIWITQTRGENVTSFKIEGKTTVENGLWSWTVPLYTIGMRLNPGPATLTEMAFDVDGGWAIEIVQNVDILLTGKPI